MSILANERSYAVSGSESQALSPAHDWHSVTKNQASPTGGRRDDFFCLSSDIPEQAMTGAIDLSLSLGNSQDKHADRPPPNPFSLLEDVPIFQFEALRDGLLDCLEKHESDQGVSREVGRSEVIEQSAGLNTNGSQKSLGSNRNCMRELVHSTPSTKRDFENQTHDSGKRNPKHTNEENNYDGRVDAEEPCFPERNGNTLEAFVQTVLQNTDDLQQVETSEKLMEEVLLNLKEEGYMGGPKGETLPSELFYSNEQRKETGIEDHRVWSGVHNGQSYRYHPQSSNNKNISNPIESTSAEYGATKRRVVLPSKPPMYNEKTCEKEVTWVPNTHVPRHKFVWKEVRKARDAREAGEQGQYLTPTAGKPWVNRDDSGALRQEQKNSMRGFLPDKENATRSSFDLGTTRKDSYVHEIYGNPRDSKDQFGGTRFNGWDLDKRELRSPQHPFARFRRPVPSSKFRKEASPMSQEQLFVPRVGSSQFRAPKRKRTRVEDLDPTQVHICSLEDCRKKFAKKYNLKIHERRHRGDLPFICDQCGKKFMWYSSFTRHLKVHSERAQAMSMRKSRKRKEAAKSEPFRIERTSKSSSRMKLNGLLVELDHGCPISMGLASSLCVLNSVPYEELFENKKDTSEDPLNHLSGNSDAESSKIDVIEQFLKEAHENNVDLRYLGNSLSYQG